VVLVAVGVLVAVEVLLAVPAGVLDTVGDAGAVVLGVLTGALLTGALLTGALLVAGTGGAVCSGEARLEAAEPFATGGVGPGHG
jgi:hypothetical protein